MELQKPTSEQWKALMALEHDSPSLMFRSFVSGRSREATKAFLGKTFDEKMWNFFEKTCPQEKFKGISKPVPTIGPRRAGPDLER
jgi:hypothetical protein